MSWAIGLAERRVLPDSAVRLGMRHVLAQRLRSEHRADLRHGGSRTQAFIRAMGNEPIAVDTEYANRQHYELPPEFFRIVLGPQLKYSCCLWDVGVRDLAGAEERMLEVTSERAGITDGMEVLDLGCGWGSLSLWIGRHFPASRILAVSNSRAQAAFIRNRCADEGIRRVEVVTADMNHYDTDRRFDRVVSVEMFEHMRNWGRLYERIAGWLRPGGSFFQHVFCHREYAYLYTDRGPSDWMARHFFTGGIMPSEDLPRRYPEHLEVVDQWPVNGLHYSRTLEAWLEAMDLNRERLAPLFEATYGRHADRWFGRWRMFFMACSELFRYRDGTEWSVSHTLMRPTR